MLMVTYAAAIFLFVLPSDFQPVSPELPWKILGLLFISTVLMPLTFVFMMLRMGRIDTMQMERQRERNWPLLTTAMIYAGGYYAIRSRAVPDFIQLFLLGAVIGMLLALVVNLKWKISLHMIGIGGLCGGITAAFMLGIDGNLWLAAGCFLAAGLLGTARLYLHAHSPVQVLAGFLTGFAVEFGLMMM